MQEELFRKKSIEKIKSPDNLNEYIKVANPGVWMILVAIIILLIGACVWGVYGRLETKISASSVADDGSIIILVDDVRIANVEKGMTVRIDDSVGEVMDVDIFSGTVSTQMNIPDGNYMADIIVDSVSPFSFIFN